MQLTIYFEWQSMFMPFKIDPVKYTELLELSNGDDSLLKDLIDKYLVNTPKLIKKTETALRENDIKTIDYCIHTMKGSSLCLGFEPIGGKLIEMNKKTKQGDISGIAEFLVELEAAVKDVREYREKI